MSSTFKIQKGFAIALGICLAIAGLVLVGAQKAVAESAAQTSATELSVKVIATGDTTADTKAWIEEKVTTDSEVILRWSGTTDGDDFIIPTEVKFGETSSYSIGTWFEVDKMQEENVAYEQKMGNKVTMTTFNKVKEYLTSKHSFSLGKLNASGEVTVTFTRVSPVYRMYNMITSEHLFTTQKAEYDGFVTKLEQGLDYWIGEGIDWFAPSLQSASNADATRVKRLYNAGLGAQLRSSHYYTSDAAEVQLLTSQYGWVEDPDVNWFTSAGVTPVYTAYSEALLSAHHYTSSWDEWRGLDAGWDKEDAKNSLSTDNLSAGGVFNCITGSNWSFAGNYYKVEHYVGGAVKDVQYVSGVAGQTTEAVAGIYNGYTAPEVIEQKTIASDNSTVVRITYNAGQNVLTGHKYEKVNDWGITWENAQAAAVARGGYLACITSQEELEFLIQDVSGVNSGYWIGLYRDPEAPGLWSENWQWINGDPFEYSYWASGEPNNYWGDGSENKALFWSSSGVWNDLRTDEAGNVTGYIIEWDVH